MKLSDELLFQLRKKDGSLSTIQHASTDGHIDPVM